MDGTRNGDLFDQTRTGCATNSCRGEGRTLLASPAGTVDMLCDECVEALTGEPAPAAATSLRASVSGVGAWAMLLVGLILLAWRDHATVGLFLTVFGVLAVAYVMERGCSRRHGYAGPSLTIRLAGPRRR